MAFGFVSYNTENDKIVLQRLRDAANVSSNLKPLFKNLISDFRRSRKAAFKIKTKGSQVTHYSGKLVRETWKSPGRPNARTRQGGLTAYENAKIKAKGSQFPYLVFNGRLRDSIIKKNSDSIEVIGKNFFVIGTKVEYASAMQYGRPEVNIPARPFMFIGPEAGKQQDRGTFDRFIKQIDDFIKKRMQQKIGK